MTYQIVAVDDTAPGATINTGLTWDGSSSLQTTNTLECGPLFLSGPLSGGSSSDITINTDKFTVDAANGDTSIGGTLTVGGVTTFNNGIALGGTVRSAQSGAVTVNLIDLVETYITNATAQLDAELPDGIGAGQMKIIILNTFDTNNLVVTPTNMANGTTITFDASGEYAMLVFDGTSWNVVSTNATVA